MTDIAHDFRAIAEALAKITGDKLDQPKTQEGTRGIPDETWDYTGAPWFPAEYDWGA